MFNVMIRSELLYPNAVVAGLLFLAFCVLLAWCWNAVRESRRLRAVFLAGAAAAAALFFAAMVFGSAPHHDEVEHANAAWQMSQGLLPFNDFFQHHSPMLWILIGPLFKIPVVADNPLDTMRLVSAGVGLIVLWLMILTAREAWKDDAVAWIVVLFFLGNFLTLQLNVLRPDVPANVCNLSAFLLIMRHRSMRAYGLAGVLLGFSLSLSPKYLPLLLLLPILMVFERKDPSFCIRALLAHAAGICAGLLPLAAWLWANGLWKPFYQWVIVFNSDRLTDAVSLFGGKFQLIPTAFALWGCGRLLRSGDGKAIRHGRLFCILMVLSASIYLRPARKHAEYYEQMYILTAVCAAAGPFLVFLKNCLAARRTVLAFLLLGAVVWNEVHAAQSGLRRGEFAEGRETIRTLKRIAGSDEVICVPPEHPITSRNAVYIDNAWQYVDRLSHPACRERLKGMVLEIQVKKPALILNKALSWPRSPDFAGHLQDQGVLSGDGAAVLRNYLAAHYRLFRIGTMEFWIRNDRTGFRG